QGPGGPVAEDEEAAVGLGEEAEEALNDAGQQGVDVEGFAEAVADLEDDPELVRGLGFEGVDAALVVDGGLDREGGLVVLQEREAEVADADAVLVAQEDAAGERHLLFVDVGVVAAGVAAAVAVL